MLNINLILQVDARFMAKWKSLLCLSLITMLHAECVRMVNFKEFFTIPLGSAKTHKIYT